MRTVGNFRARALMIEVAANFRSSLCKNRIKEGQIFLFGGACWACGVLYEFSNVLKVSN